MLKLKKSQKKIKIISVVLVVLFWVTLLCAVGVLNGKGTFLYPEYAEPSVLRFICSLGYVGSFFFMVYNFCESKKLLIWYSIYAGLIIIPLCTVLVLGQDNPPSQFISALNVLSGMLIMSTLIIPLGVTLYILGGNSAAVFVVILLLFYPVYFVSKYIRKRKSVAEIAEQA